jgi:PAS domain S-box-containing protein
MLIQIKRWLEPPHFEGDEEKTTQARIANSLIVYLGAALLIVIFILIPLFAFQKIGSWILSIAIFSALVVGRRFIFRGQLRLGSTLIFSVIYLCILSMLILSGGSSGTAMFYFATVVLIAGYFLDARVVNGFTIPTFLIAMGITILQDWGLVALPKVFMFNSIFSWLATGLGLVFMIRTRDLFVGNLKSAIASAQHKNAALQEAEATLRESEEKFKAQYKGIPIPTYSWQCMGDDLILVDYNDSAFKFTQERIVNLLGKTASAVYRDNPETFSELIECSRKKINSKCERWHRLASTGEMKYIAINYAFVPPDLVMVHTEDITERKNAETRNLIIAEVQDKLLHPCNLEDIYRLVAEKTQQLIGNGITATSILDKKRRTVRMGSYYGADIPLEKMLSILGFDPWQKEFSLDDMTEEDLRIYRSGRLGMLEGGLYTLMTRLVPQPACLLIEKRLRVQKIYGMGFVCKNEHLGSLVILARDDITPHIAAIEQIVNLAAIVIERNLAEEEVKNSEKRFHALIEHGRDNISLLAADGILLWENPSVNSTLGYAPDQFVGRNIFELMHPEDQTWTSAMYAQVVQSPGNIQEGEFRLLHVDGAWRWIECSAMNLLDEPSVQAIVINYRDITDRKQRENELQAIATLSAALRAAPTRTEMLPVIIEQLVVLLDCKAASIEIIDPLTRDSVTEVALGAWESLIGVRQKNGTGINAIISQTRQPYYTNNLHHDPNFAHPELVHTGIHGGIGAPLIAQDNLIGFVWMGRRTEVVQSDVRLFSAIADITANAIHRATLHEQAQKNAADLTLAYDTTLEGWAHALELRDHETEGHTRRVVQMTINLARTMGIGDDELENIRRGALLHDIGKMGIPDSILLKPDVLDEREWEIMKRHPEYACKLLEPIEYLRPVLDIPYCHHEKWDGTGYPRGLKGEQIPLPARIFAIADVWDALTSDRPYRAGWAKEKVLEYIKRLEGRHFDPTVVEAFLKTA